jgi:hypothetical protein
MTNEETMALCAIRYTMGRRSYIVSDGQRWAIEWGKKSKWVRDVIIRDLEHDIARCDDGFEALGDKVDENGWRRVLEALRDMNK